MRRLDVLREAQLAAVEAPMRALRGGVALWLLARVVLGELLSATSPTNLWLLFVLVGTRVAGAALRRSVYAGIALAVGVTVLGVVGVALNAAPGREVGALLPYGIALTVALWAHGKRARTAADDLLRYDRAPDLG